MATVNVRISFEGRDIFNQPVQITSDIPWLIETVANGKTKTHNGTIDQNGNIVILLQGGTLQYLI